jgi:hypothetical protein
MAVVLTPDETDRGRLGRLGSPRVPTGARRHEARDPAEPEPIPDFKFDQSGPDFDFGQSLPDSLDD